MPFKLGSPPRMRGKVASEMILLALERITPAYAGKRHVCSAPYKGTGDHPRVCGEKALSTFSSRKNSGSPPRMRGKVQPDADGCRPPGITPAYAGKRMLYARAVRRDRDHPRVCGEKPGRPFTKTSSMGSPSRMRGKAGWPLCGLPCIGITPAYAGKRHKACCEGV